MGRSRALSLEGTVRVKEREIERLMRLMEAAKVCMFVRGGGVVCVCVCVMHVVHCV